MVQEPHFGIFSTEMFEQEYKDLYKRMFTAVYYIIIVIAITTWEAI